MVRSPLRKKTALVTGGTGYIGFYLIKKLLRDGWKVHALVPGFDDPKKLAGLSGRLSVHRYDGKTETVSKILRRTHPDTVFHLAAKICVDHESEDIEPTIEANILLGTQLLEGMKREGVRDFINTGSFWQHFEGKSYDPVNLYAASKQAFEDILRFYTEACGIRSITLKLFNVYGPADSRNKIIPLFEKYSKSGKLLTMSPGKQMMDLVYIDDVVKAFCHAAKLIKKLKGNKPENCYAVTSSRHIALRKVAAIYQKIAGRDLRIQWGGRPYRAREVMVPWKGKPLPGWRPAVTLEMGIRKIGGS
ncbi:MAG: NAD-dependent epimerase/dehydratase family protein [Candidatus Omnitrophota bacterium]